MSNIDLVLLGLIKQKSQSAYDIKKNIEYRNIPRWVKISEQSIYKKVLQLESKEYIVSHKEKEGNMPDKAIYTITNKGNDYFNKLMNDISNSDVSLYLDFNVIITNLDLVDDEQKQILVSNIKSKILELKELLNERRSHRQHIPNVGKQMFKQQLALVETLEKWIIDFENKIINIGILAHVDAGKTTLTESLLYTSGAILELGSVDKGTTRTDTMFLERQRGITIQAAVTSFNWNDYKINIVDTPGHTDFITEVYRSLSVLDGAILVISAKDGVQAQTRILFHALQKMNIPTIIFINKIDQDGINLNNIYQNIKEKLSNDIIVMQNVTLTPEISIKNIIDLDDWDPVISKNDKLLEKYIVGEKLTIQELMYEEYRCVKKGSLFPIYHGSARNNIGTQQLIEAISNLFCSEMNENDSELCGRVFKIEYTDHKQRLVYLRLYSGTLHLRDTIMLPEKKKMKLTEIYIPSNGEMIQTKIVCSGDIFIIPNNTLRLNDIIGNEKILPCNVWNDKTVPILRTRIEPIKIEEREKLLDALTEIADTDPLLRYYVDTITHEIIISFLGTVQLEVICSLLIEKYHINIRIEDPTVIYLEKPLQKADYTIHIEVPPNPFWASIGLSITPLPIGKCSKRRY